MAVKLAKLSVFCMLAIAAAPKIGLLNLVRAARLQTYNQESSKKWKNENTLISFFFFFAQALVV